MVRVDFKRRHLYGDMSGLLTEDHITFVDRVHAFDWLIGIIINTALGVLSYELEDYDIKEV